ncbi:Uu.00g114490.m01.CDS01 [Anthostomella pinea]|uniref:Uu.00g114490.m01.CDS01 n=1 Tax=Anthostomella pinea TaxID=933095 RepID=A0AAI8VFP3_9PEZI|nr:Uu.00g114490.m01.CDS01 [Anthostomella pinea]
MLFSILASALVALGTQVIAIPLTPPEGLHHVDCPDYDTYQTFLTCYSQAVVHNCGGLIGNPVIACKLKWGTSCGNYTVA